jgi:hypothetical protein
MGQTTESQYAIPYTAIFEGKNDLLRLNNAFVWATTLLSTETWRGPTPRSPYQSPGAAVESRLEEIEAKQESLT